MQADTLPEIEEAFGSLRYFIVTTRQLDNPDIRATQRKVAW